MNKQWSGTTHQTLKAHIDRHQSAFVSLSETSDYVSHQLPNERTRVGYLIDSITSTDVNVVAALASIRMDDTGRREDFEEASIFLDGNVYDSIERTLTGTSHSSVIIRFRHTRNGKVEMDALVSQFAGKVVWENRIKYA